MADANVLLSALVGNAAEKVFYQKIQVYTSAVTVAEALEYLQPFCERYKVPIEVGLRQLANLSMEVKERNFYASFLEDAHKLMDKLDPDDVDVAALALKLGVPVWSNDNHFKNFPQGRYTTAQLLKALGV